MNPRDKAAGKRTIGSSSNWSCSLPPDTPFSMTPLPTRYRAGSSHLSPGQSPVMALSSSQVFSLPLNTSPMSSPPRTPSLSLFPDSLTTWSPYPYASFTDLLNHGEDLFTNSANENALVFGSGPPPLMMTQPSSQAHSLPLSTFPMFSPSSSTSVADLLNHGQDLFTNSANENGLLFGSGPPPLMMTQPSSQAHSLPLSTSPMFSPSSSTSVADLLNLLPSPNWSFQSNVPVTNSRNENAFSSRPQPVTTQPSSQAFSFPFSRSPILPSTPSASLSTWNNSLPGSFTELLNQVHSPNWNLQSQVFFTTSQNENAFSSGQPSYQVSSSLPVSLPTWSTSPTVSFSNSVNQFPSPNWNLHGHVPFTNPVNGNENALSLSPYTSQAPTPSWNFQSPNNPNTPYELNQISTSSKHAGRVSDPKKVQRILKNRESAARSWEKKQRLVTDLIDRIKFLEEAYASRSSKISTLEEENKMLRKFRKQRTNQKQTKDQDTQVSDDDLTEHLVADTEMHNSDEFNKQETSLECVSESSQGS